MIKIPSLFNKRISRGLLTLFSAAILLSSCNGCSRHGSCPAYTYKAKKDALQITGKALQPVADEA